MRLENEDVSKRMGTGFVEAGRDLGALAASLGITTLCDRASGVIGGVDELDRYQEMYVGGRMTARTRASLFAAEEAGWDAAGIRVGRGDALMRAAGSKVVTDGSNRGFAGRQREPCPGTDPRQRQFAARVLMLHPHLDGRSTGASMLVVACERLMGAVTLLEISQ